MQPDKFEDKQWERHGDYWLLVGSNNMPAAILMRVETLEEKEQRENGNSGATTCSIERGSRGA